MSSELKMQLADDIAISVRSLSKTYRLFDHPGDRVKQFISFGFKRYHREFAALEEVSLDIKKGETIGIIGKNGSGKSTLLQLICGILKPSFGSVITNGRISALLELGAGFNPEFTGRENVYFQGALMGFTQTQMDQRFADIAAFADIGEFIDQPVRTYSSGMFVRLAFSVSISVEPNILVVDEALAVGDTAFQARCFERIQQLKLREVTILLVSHSMAQILSCADRALLLDRGRVIADAEDVTGVVNEYEAISRNAVSSTRTNQESLPLARVDIGEARFGSFEATINAVRVIQNGVETSLLQPGKPTELIFAIESKRAFDAVVLGVAMRRPGSGDLWGDNNLLAGHPLALREGINTVRYAFSFPLTGGEYLLYCGLTDIGSGGRVELDQRRPMEMLTVAAGRPQVGFAHGPVTVTVEGQGW